MSLSIWVSPDQQIGQIPEEARRGQRQRKLTEAIKDYLFAYQDEEKANAALSDAIESFREAAETFSVENPTARDLWKQWFSRQGDDDPSGYVEMFCLTLHGLCWALAESQTQPTDWAISSNEESSEEQDDTEDADEQNDEKDDLESTDSSLWVYQHEARMALARVLWRYAWRERCKAENEQTVTDCLELIAGTLLDCMFKAMPDQFEVGEPERETVEGRPRTRVRIIAKNPDLARRVEGFLQKFPFHNTMQPLSKPVKYQFDTNVPSHDTEETFFKLDLIGYRRKNGFLRELHRDTIECSNRKPVFGTYVEAVNRQQAVAWRLNRTLLYWIECLIDIANSPTMDEWRKETTDAVGEAKLTSKEIEGWRSWLHENFYRPKAGRKRREPIKRPAEFLDNPLARETISGLKEKFDATNPRPVAEGKKLAELTEKPGPVQQEFFLPWKADYRGRIYAETPWFTPQGGDVQRALLEFARGQVLRDDGCIALCRHGANLADKEKVLDNLGITDRQVLTFEERERWVKDWERKILDSAHSPLKETFWRDVSRKPAQFLAFCLAYKSWKQDPEALIHVPVQIDGSCNGLQHIAALTRNEDLARAVNVLAREDGLPGDIYSDLAQEACKTIGQLPEVEKDTTHKEGLELADRWLAKSLERQSWINRDTAKKVVMTIPYGASPGSQSGYVLDAIIAELDKAWNSGSAPSNEELDELSKWGVKHKTRLRFIRKCTRGHLKELRRKKRESDTKAARLLEGREVFYAYVARVIVKHIRLALQKHFPCVDVFSDWLQNTAKACSGLPLMWPTPLGFPVCQDKFKIEETSLTGRLGANGKDSVGQNASEEAMQSGENAVREDGSETSKKEKEKTARVVAYSAGETISVKVARLSEAVEHAKQTSAVLPNLIHSLDATHMAMTINRAYDNGIVDIGSIHDCLLCHPNDATKLSSIVRKTFSDLYAPDSVGRPKPLAEWQDWMEISAKIRRVPRKWARYLKAALDEPGGLGEMTLVNTRAKDDAQRGNAQALLKEIRALSPLKKLMACRLVESRVNQNLNDDAGTDLPALKLGTLQLSSISEYFFS